MTERALGDRQNAFIATVVNRDDPLQTGRVQIRIHSKHDDKSQIPDDKLLWAHQALSVTSPSLNGVGQSPTGIQVGATVHGYFQDRDKQIPVITHTVHRAEDAQKGKEGHSVHHGARDQKTGGKDHNRVLNKNVIQHAQQGMKHPKLATISQEIDVPRLLQAVMKLDPQNLSGSIKNMIVGHIGLKGLLGALNMMSDVKSMVNAAQQLMGTLQSLQGLIPKVLSSQIANIQNLNVGQLQQVISQVSTLTGIPTALHQELLTNMEGVLSEKLIQESLAQGSKNDANSGDTDQALKANLNKLMSLGGLGAVGSFAFMIDGVMTELDSFFNKTFSS